jgi:hypothetical protein
MFNIADVNFFDNLNNIKYVTSWDGLWNNAGLELRFYKGDPKYIVDVTIFADKDRLVDTDIQIAINRNHNAADIKEVIESKQKEILELCRDDWRMSFVLDLKKMKILDILDFTEFLPTSGLNSLFILKGRNNDNGFYRCLVNAAHNDTFSNDEFISWFITYIYSSCVCLTPMNNPDDYAKQILQFLSAKSAGFPVKIITNPSILHCTSGDMRQLTIEVPGKLTRFNELLKSSLEELKKSKLKKEKGLRNARN